MRAILIPAVAALGLGLTGTSAVLAAPASDDAIAQAAYDNPLIQPVWWHHWHYSYHWHWHWRA
jgi:hypothetical protein